MNDPTNSNPEFGASPEDLAAFTDTIDTINAHNEQFSMGSLLASTMIEGVETAEREHDLVEAGASPEEAAATVEWVGNDKVPLDEEQEMARAVLGTTHAPVLGAVGLRLSPVDESSVMFGPKGKTTVGAVRVEADDVGKFGNFLSTVDPGDADDDFKEKIAGVVNRLILEAADAIIAGEDEQAILEGIFANNKEVLSGLESIGLSDSTTAETLRTMAEHYKQGDIKEYIQAERIGLFQEPGSYGFGPSLWQRDEHAEGLTNRWGNVIDILKAAKTNPNAQALFKELLADARAALSYAREDWSKMQDEGKYNETYGQGFDEVLQGAARELDTLGAPQSG